MVRAGKFELSSFTVDDDTQRKADQSLSNEPLVKTSYKIAQLVMIAHDWLAEIRGDPPGLRDAYIRACIGGPADKLGPGGKRPEIVLAIKGNDVVEAEARDAFTLEVILTAAEKNPTLMRLLNEIESDLGWPRERALKVGYASASKA